MKIAVSSDWHGMDPTYGVKEQILECDMLLLCGDIFEDGVNNGRLIRFLGRVRSAGIPVIMTPGNHDWFLFSEYLKKFPEERELLKFNAGDLRRKHPFSDIESFTEQTGIKVLIDEDATVNGIRIYGTPWSPEFCQWAFMGSEDYLAKKYSKIPEGIDILISHTPPRRDEMRIDCVEADIKSGRCSHLGSSSLTEAVITKRPKYLFCGHIHTGNHGEEKLGDTICCNVSHLNEAYEHEFPVKTFEITACNTGNNDVHNKQKFCLSGDFNADLVNHPAHYRHKSGLDAIVWIDRFSMDFCTGNCFKYLFRRGLKDGQSREQDEEKAKWYFNHEVDLLYNAHIENYSTKRELEADFVIRKLSAAFGDPFFKEDEEGNCVPDWSHGGCDMPDAIKFLKEMKYDYLNNKKSEKQESK